MVEPTTLSCRKNTRARSAGGFGPLVAPDTTTVPPGRSDRSECAHVASPDGLDHGVDPPGSRAPGLERLVRAELEGTRALGLVAARDPHLEAR